MSYQDNGYISRVGYKQQFSAGATGPPLGPFGGHPTLSVDLMSAWTFDGEVLTPPDDDYYGNDLLNGRHFIENTTGPTVIAGKNANGIVCGAGTYFYLPIPGDGEDFDLSVIGDFSLSAWVYRTSGSMYAFRESSTAFSFEGSNMGSAIVYDSVSGASGINSPTAASDQWNLIVVGYQSGDMKAFASINGAAKTLAATPLDNGPKPFAGSQLVTAQTGGPGSNRRLDEMYTWNKVLSDPEIADLYAAGAGLFY